MKADRRGSKRRSAKHKVPPAYSRADENARSLDGHRDDEAFRRVNARDHLTPVVMTTCLKGCLLNADC
jgi:hypothetical protein